MFKAAPSLNMSHLQTALIGSGDSSSILYLPIPRTYEALAFPKFLQILSWAPNNAVFNAVSLAGLWASAEPPGTTYALLAGLWASAEPPGTT